MEKASSISSTPYSYSEDLSSTTADMIAFVLYNIFLWVVSIHEVSFRFLCFTQLSKPVDGSETPTADSTNSSERSELDHLSAEDLETVMQKMGISDQEQEKTKENVIAFDEVLGIFEEKEPSLEEAMEAFSVFDKNSDGFIDASELQSVLSELGFKTEVGLDECRGMIEVYDENKDGRIDFNEFLKFLESSLC